MDERIERGHEKRSPADFALWKFSPTEGPRRKMEWESPWGVGFPGWHIECSAMSSKYLGVPFDVHTGGVDHIPVHHPNEIAQSENAFEVRPWVRYWLHEEFLLFGGDKMAKSKGEVLTLTDLEALGIEPLAYRLFFLSAHYRQQQSYSESAIEGAQSAYQRLVRHAVELREADDRTGSKAVEGYRERFQQALDDDLNAPQGLAVLWEVIRSSEIGGAEKWELVCEWDRVLGLGLEEAHLEEIELDERVEALVREREEARRTRNFARADEIREELTRQGIVLEDTKEGTRWRRA
jgi:cysteinyl-tRNA synthetase